MCRSRRVEGGGNKRVGQEREEGTKERGGERESGESEEEGVGRMVCCVAKGEKMANGRRGTIS